MAQPSSISLTILRKGDTNLIDLAETGVLIPRSETRVDDAFLREVSAEVGSIVLPGYGRDENVAVVRGLQRIGGLMFSHLLPEAAQRRLRAAHPCDLYLRLDESLVQVPWELCYDGEQFLGNKFHLGRQVITSAPLPERAAIQRGQGALRVLLIADPTETLPQASKEAERLCAVLGGIKGIEVTLLGGREVRRVPLLAALEAHEVVHFAGHSRYDAQTPSHSGWVLQEGILTAGELGKLRHPPVLVFSNSCQAGATVAWQSNSRYEGQAFGIGSAFLLAGVTNYIGTFWVVHDEESAVFATAFYHSLTAGQSLGEALSQARQTLIAQHGWQGLTWASYMLYGDPTFTVLPTTQTRSLANVSVAAQPQRAQVLPRKLAAILSADVKGYSRLMGEDEEGTIRTLTAYREVMTALIQQHHGRVVDAPGDNLLAEFASAVDAVQCAGEIQKELQTRNAELPDRRHMQYRIGINIGDVIVEGERIYGDGVNIAARLEALAEGGGICISGTVYDQVETKLTLGYEYLGEQTVKNITKPVRVYRVLTPLAPAPPVVSHQLSVDSHQKTEGSSAQLVTAHWQLATPLVGREPELAQLHRWLEKALNGERQVVFVTGEPGIGKTSLVETFLQTLGSRVQRLESEQDQRPEESQKVKGKGQQAKVEDRFLIPDLRSPAPSTQHPTPSPWLGQGQCIEHYGAGEAYLPILEALGRLCRELGGERLIALLQQHAPTWLVQMPALLGDTELETLQRKTQGVTRERMLRELAEAMEALTAERSLVLWLEDLHWSDVSTLDWLAYVARRQERARLLIIGTYRPMEVLTRGHPLKGIKQELQIHGHCQELALDFLAEEHVAAYLEARFASPSPALAGEGRGEQCPYTNQLAHLIHQRTDGNPLFMVNVVNALVTQGVETRHVASLQSLEELGIRTPENLRQMIEQQIARVHPDERKILEAASVAGAEFSAAAVAAAVEQSVEAVETQCDGLVRREQFLRARGTSEWPDKTIAAQYGFVHALYQEVLYEQISASRRIRLHRQIGEREEQGYGNQAGEIAAELAVHFERGRDYERAVQYRQQAGQRASQRGANTEAVNHVTTGLRLLKTLPNTPARTQQELSLQLTLGGLRMATHGWASPEAEHAYRRARELCQQIGNKEQVFPVLCSMVTYHAMRAEHRKARELAEEVFRTAHEVQDPELLIGAHYAQGSTLEWTGEFPAALAHLEQGIALYDPQRHRALILRYGNDPGVACWLHAMQVLWLLGYPDQALMRAKEALTLTQDLSHATSVVRGLTTMAQIRHLRREWQAAQERSEAALAFATEFGLPYAAAQASILLGGALSGQGHYADGIAKMCQGLAAQRATGGQGLLQYWLTMQLEAYIETGQFEEAWTVLKEALTIRPKYGDRYWEEEVYRLNGELLLAEARSNPEVQDSQQRAAIEAKAETCFQRAIETAREQKTKSLELRATTSLARLWQQQGKKKQAHQMLSEIYNWFTEGFDTKDLQEAKALLEAVGEMGK